MYNFVLYVLSVIFLALPELVGHVFANATVEQTIFHVQFILDVIGGGQGVSGEVRDLVLFFTIIPPLFVAMVFCIVQILRMKFAWVRSILDSKKICSGVFLAAGVNFFYQADLYDYYKINRGDDLFSSVYIHPDMARITHERNGKNLILIYFESLETSLRDRRIHKENHVEKIDELGGYGVEVFPAAPGTNWTIAGMVASQCSIPLRTYFLKSSELKSGYLPGAICLGDILRLHGYEQYFLGGSDIRFTGKDKFYKDHGFQHVYGSEELKRAGLDPGLFTGWGGGIHDDTLLDQAKKIIRGGKLLDQPYNLTLLTVDTHSPSGYPSPRCLDKEKMNGLFGVYQCTSRFVGDFVSELKAENLLDDTVVVIMGDHPFHNASSQKQLFAGSRNVYIRFLYDGTIMPKRNRITHFDVAPSILDLLGFAVGENTQFGLGFSVFSDIDSDQYDRHFEKVISRDILNHSAAYEGLQRGVFAD